MLDCYKVKKILVKKHKGKLVAIQVELGDGSTSPIFGEQDYLEALDIPTEASFTRISIKE